MSNRYADVDPLERFLAERVLGWRGIDSPAGPMYISSDTTTVCRWFEPVKGRYGFRLIEEKVMAQGWSVELLGSCLTWSCFIRTTEGECCFSSMKPTIAEAFCEATAIAYGYDPNKASA